MNRDGSKGTLYVVATPIGNMEDITLRALRVLKEVDLIAAEDTRLTKRLLSHYGIHKPLVSYFEHNEPKRAPMLIERLNEGMDIALLTDAGTPGISDPGYRLVRLAIENSIPVTTIPGPSAIISALSIAGLPTDRFTFLGFVPPSKGRKRRFFLELRDTESTFVVYESPRRLIDTIRCMVDLLGDVEVTVLRELTKLHEEVIRGRAKTLLEDMEKREIKGEVTIVFRTERRKRHRGELEVEIERLLREGLPVREIVRAMAGEFEMPKTEVYRIALALKDRASVAITKKH